MPENSNEFKNEPYIRAVYCDNNSTYEDFLQKANLPTFYTRRLQDIATIMYKVKNNLAPPYIADSFMVNNSQYSLRNSEFVLPRFQKVAYGKHSISYLGPVIWSKLNPFIRSSESVNTCKTRIKSMYRPFQLDR